MAGEVLHPGAACTGGLALRAPSPSPCPGHWISHNSVLFRAESLRRKREDPVTKWEGSRLARKEISETDREWKFRQEDIGVGSVAFAVAEQSVSAVEICEEIWRRYHSPREGRRYSHLQRPCACSYLQGQQHVPQGIQWVSRNLRFRVLAWRRGHALAPDSPDPHW